MKFLTIQSEDKHKNMAEEAEVEFVHNYQNLQIRYIQNQAKHWHLLSVGDQKIQ